MASWTDNPQLLTNFTPYVHELPVDAMVKVGMAKQQQYDEGIQKIQANIDNVAGLDISRDVDKAYLQTKLNQLSSDSRLFAMADFSNAQMVNSVNGMTNSIIKDNVIQNAVSSTAKLRKESAAKDEAKKAGKSSIQNEWDFNLGASEYLNSTDLKKGYNGSYKPYTDMSKKLRDLADKIHESDTAYDNPFQRDAAGNTLYFDSKGNASTDPTKGSPRQDDAMLHVESKAKSAQKILTTFYDSLTPDDIEQLSIDGRYHYKDADTGTFIQGINSDYNSTKKVLTDGANDISIKIQSGKLSNKEKALYEAQLTDINRKLNDGGLEKQRDEQISKINNIQDVEGYKAKLYTQSWLTNLAQDISYDDKKYELKTNPYEQANDRRLQLQLAYNREAREARQFEMTFARDNAHWEYEQTAKAMEAAEKKKKETFTAVDPGVISTNINTPTLNKLGQEITGIVGKRDVNNKIVEQGELDKLNLKAFSLIPGGSDMSFQQKEKHLATLAANYAKDPGSINSITNSPGLRKYLESRRNLEIDLALKQRLFNEVKKESKKYDDTINKVLKTEPGVLFSNGKQMYSANDVYNFAKQAEGLKGPLPASKNGLPSPEPIPGQGYVDPNKLLKMFKGTKQEALAYAYIKHQAGKELTSTEKVLFNRTRDILRKYDPQIKQIHKEKLQFQSDYLAKNAPERQTQVGTLNMSDKGTKSRVVGLIGNLLEKQNSLGSFDVTKSKDADSGVISQLMASGGTTYTVVKKADGSAEIVLKGILGKDKATVRQALPVTAKELQNHFPEIAVMNPLNRAKQAIESSKYKTTNLFTGQGSAGAVTSMFSGYDLPQLRGSNLEHRVRYDIEGDPSNDGTGDDGYTLKMYVQPYGSRNWVEGYLNQNYVPLSGIQETINAIGNTTIDSFLTKNK